MLESAFTLLYSASIVVRCMKVLMQVHHQRKAALTLLQRRLLRHKQHWCCPKPEQGPVRTVHSRLVAACCMLQEGVVMALASDHSPSPCEDKKLAEGNFLTAWGGVSGVELCFALLCSAALSGKSLACIFCPGFKSAVLRCAVHC